MDIVNAYGLTPPCWPVLFSERTCYDRPSRQSNPAAAGADRDDWPGSALHYPDHPRQTQASQPFEVRRRRGVYTTVRSRETLLRHWYDSVGGLLHSLRLRRGESRHSWQQPLGRFGMVARAPDRKLLEHKEPVMQKQGSQAGFTLIELLLVIIIVGFFLTAWATVGFWPF